MNVIIFGGEGFIGSHIALQLAELDYNVIIAGNYKRNSIKFFTRTIEDSGVHKIYGHHFDDKMRYINGHMCDITNERQLAALFAIYEPEMVINCAAIAGVSNYIKYPVETLTVNGIGTANILELCRKYNVKKTIIMSSSEVYGDCVDTSENMSVVLPPPTNLRTSYAMGKLFGDHLALAYFDEYQIPISIIRPFGIFGPGQIGEGAIQIFIGQIVAGQDVTVVHPGNQTRCWCYIDDLVDATIKLLHSNINGEIVNISGPIDNNITIMQLAQKIIQMCSSKSKIILVHRDSPEIHHRVASITKAQQLLDWIPLYSIERGLAKTIAWYVKNNVKCEFAKDIKL